jgi:hypothetical protein
VSNVPFVTYMDYATNLSNVMNDILPIFPVVQAALAAEMLLNPVWATIEMSEGEINDTLRLLTGLTVATGSDLNCYPRGLDLTTCFDIDGNEVP